MAIVECKNLTVAYGDFVALKEVSFELPPSSYTCIVGVNGSGKTTLVKTLLGLNKKVSGTVRLNCQNIGYLPQQNPVQKDFPATVFEVVLSGVSAKKLFLSKADKLKTLSAMETLGLTSKAKQSYATLSGGQRQRVLLARALCALNLNEGGEKLLVLDEPATGLDALIAKELYTTLCSLQKEKGVTLLMVSHDVKKAVASATHILHLDNKLLFFGKSLDYTKTPAYHKIEHTEVCSG